jgi:F0F1-type ATP synthase assembly protein I
VASYNLAQVDFGQGVSNAWNSIAAFVPKFVAFLVILVIGWIVAKAIRKIVDKVLERVHFDRAVERGGIKQMLSRSKYDASDIVAKLLYYAVLLITLQIAFGVWGPNPVSAMLTGIVAWLPRAAVAIIIVVVAAAIAKAVKDLVTGALSGVSYGKVLGTIASVFIWGLGIIAALNQIGVAVSVTTPVLITVLATLGGVIVVGAGGGLIRPMQQRWESWLGKAEEEVSAVKGQAQAYQRGREDAHRAEQSTERAQPGELETQTTPGTGQTPPPTAGHR